MIDLHTQAPYYPRFAMNNTYGIRAINESVVRSMYSACHKDGGCLDLLSRCGGADRFPDAGNQDCARAAYECRTYVEEPYYVYRDRSAYDIRFSAANASGQSYFEKFLNTAGAQNALGVDLNYTALNWDVFSSFEDTGDLAYPNFLSDLGALLNNSVSVVLYCGDADYVCNWFGGEAASLNISYTHSMDLRQAKYRPFILGGIEYGQVRQASNLSVVRYYSAGHHVAWSQPKASLEMFRRALNHVDLATGQTTENSVYQQYQRPPQLDATHGRRILRSTTSVLRGKLS